MSHHPEISVLESYANGTIDPIEGVAVATHLEMCPHCIETVRALEQSNAADAFKFNEASRTNSSSAEMDFSSMFDAIVEKEVYSPSMLLSKAPIANIEVAGKKFTLPKTLSRHADRISEWRSYGGKVYSAAVDLGEDARVNLMYINNDVHIPQHTHRGLESTLVLHGGFSDEDGHYEVGDFMVRDASVKHSPFTKQGEDCLCLTILTEPMIFTQGVARVFNLFGKGMYP